MQCRFSTTWIPRVCQFPPLQRDKSTWVPFKHAGELTWLIATCKLRRSRCSASPKVVRGFGIFRGEPSERRERVFGADDLAPIYRTEGASCRSQPSPPIHRRWNETRGQFVRRFIRCTIVRSKLMSPGSSVLALLWIDHFLPAQG